MNAPIGFRRVRLRLRSEEGEVIGFVRPYTASILVGMDGRPVDMEIADHLMRRALTHLQFCHAEGSA